MRVLAVFFVLFTGACAVELAEPPANTSPSNAQLPTAQQAAENFVAVVQRVEPVAEDSCRKHARNLNCDFQILVDRRITLPPNAFQTVDELRRPVIIFTIALIAQARNQDELAFILGHEAAHHIREHLPKQNDSAFRGALAAGLIARLGGASEAVVERATQVGAQIGARAYSKDFELEADALGAVIAKRAGYDAVLGARYFTRIADPGNQFLGTHPPNAQRIATVERVVSGG